MNYYQILKPFLFTLDAETAHNLAIKILQYNLLPKPRVKEYPILKNNLWDIDFNNPVGMAAGFDKNAQIFTSLFDFGFGFVECGTVTPKPQAGNPKPRIFRLEEDEAIINRLGFNNKGLDHFKNNIKNYKIKRQIVGINIGKNKDTVQAIDDYLLLLEQLYELSSYITVNISSPNTENLRDLQHANQLQQFLSQIMLKKQQLLKNTGENRPLLLKIAPDLTKKQQQQIAEIALQQQIDGLIISNTTIGNREKLISKYKNQNGGLSGKVLFKDSTLILKNIYNLTEGKIPLIGVGGIAGAKDAYKKIKAGASLIQIYSAFIYQSFGLVESIKEQLAALIAKDGFENISQAIGVNSKKPSASQ